jgi:hypothetical protein
MSITLVATAGSASANSYASVADATTYLAAKSGASAWASATSSAKQQALISATRALNALTWPGQRVDTTQALAWPRAYVTDLDAPVGSVEFSSTAIPQWLEDATCELAFEVVRGGTTDIFALPGTDGVIEKTVGPLTTRYAEPYAQAKGLRRYPLVWALVSRYVQGTGGFQVPLVRG